MFKPTKVIHIFCTHTWDPAHWLAVSHSNTLYPRRRQCRQTCVPLAEQAVWAPYTEPSTAHCLSQYPSLSVSQVNSVKVNIYHIYPWALMSTAVDILGFY